MGFGTPEPEEIYRTIEASKAAAKTTEFPEELARHEL
jgi:hypothetical protein